MAKPFENKNTPPASEQEERSPLLDIHKPFTAPLEAIIETLTAEQKKKLEKPLADINEQLAATREQEHALDSQKKSLLDGVRSNLNKYLTAIVISLNSMAGPTMPESIPKSTPTEKRTQKPENETPASIHDFDKINIDIDNEKINTLINSVLPDSWGKEIHEIRTGELAPHTFNNTMGQIEEWRTIALATSEPEPEVPVGNKTNIIFDTKSFQVESTQYLIDVLMHETAHANDWRNSSKLTPKQRVYFHDAIRARIHADDHFMSDYVESIGANPSKTFTKKEQEDFEERKTQEYWAEIFKEYMNNAPIAEADTQLVDLFIQTTDPSFNREKALSKKDELLRNIVLEQKLKIGRSLNAVRKTNFSYQLLDQTTFSKELYNEPETKDMPTVADAAPEDQPAARIPFIEQMTEAATTPERKQALQKFIAFYKTRMDMFRLAEQDNMPEAMLVMHKKYQEQQQQLDSDMKKLPAEDRDALETVFNNISEHLWKSGLIMSDFEPAGEITPVEGSLLNEQNEWIREAAGWPKSSEKPGIVKTKNKPVTVVTLE